jgi:hypothetical protein
MPQQLMRLGRNAWVSEPPSLLNEVTNARSLGEGAPTAPLLDASYGGASKFNGGRWRWNEHRDGLAMTGDRDVSPLLH